MPPKKPKPPGAHPVEKPGSKGKKKPAAQTSPVSDGEGGWRRLAAADSCLLEQPP
eukprot:gene31957-20079_t